MARGEAMLTALSSFFPYLLLFSPFHVLNGERREKCRCEEEEMDDVLASLSDVRTNTSNKLNLLDLI